VIINELVFYCCCSGKFVTYAAAFNTATAASASIYTVTHVAVAIAFDDVVIVHVNTADAVAIASFDNVDAAIVLLLLLHRLLLQFVEF
jgi:hypothetical protein